MGTKGPIGPFSARALAQLRAILGPLLARAVLSGGASAHRRHARIGDRRPYFLWDEDISIDELRTALAAGGHERDRLDLVREPVPQIHPEKPEHDGIRVDPPDEILANKLTALVGRAEERDLVDVWFLERAGYPVELALEAALAKDGGCTPATLAWVLSQIEIPDGIHLPGGIEPGWCGHSWATSSCVSGGQPSRRDMEICPGSMADPE